jgi:hypothetical protein
MNFVFIKLIISNISSYCTEAVVLFMKPAVAVGRPIKYNGFELGTNQKVGPQLEYTCGQCFSASRTYACLDATIIFSWLLILFHTCAP